MKFHEARQVSSTRTTKQKWRDHLVMKYRHRILLNSSTITELKGGLELGLLLELPFDLSCNHMHLTDLLVTDSAVRPFYQLKYVPGSLATGAHVIVVCCVLIGTVWRRLSVVLALLTT